MSGYLFTAPSSVFSSLGPLIVSLQRAERLFGGIGWRVEFVKEKLTAVRCCLRYAHSKCLSDESLQCWLNELLDVTYRIEDKIDTLFLKVEDPSQKSLSVCLNLKKMWVKHISNELHKIESEVKRISDIRVYLELIELQGIEVSDAVRRPVGRATYQEANETDGVGLLIDHKNNIMKFLQPENTPSQAVITIVGRGGLGKTSLACMVYTSARAEFDYCIMMSISQQFSLIDLLSKMLHQLEHFAPKNQDVGDLISELKKTLSNKRYLIILDDVQEVDLWYQLKDALPDDMNGSRVLMTSTLMDVAKSTDSIMAPYELRFLNDKESEHLLLKKALPDLECPNNLVEVAEKLSKKCKGLPLVLIVVGGLLSTKERNCSTWERVLQTMDSHSDDEGCIDVLVMSYQDMSYYLKKCFLYLASFPKNYEISAKSLIRMWKAEEFIPQKGKMGEDLLEELSQRSMIQVSSRSINGSIKCCQVHDVLRDLAMRVAREENIFTVFSQASDFNQPNRETRASDLNQPNRGIRHASLQSYSSQVMEHVGQNIRSLLWFGQDLPDCSNFRLLKVLEVVGIRNNTLEPFRGLDGLIFLKYLGFRNCEISISCSFRDMKCLETLDMRGTQNVVSDALWKIHTLRHVLCDSGLNEPISSTYPEILQTMRWISLSRARDWYRSLKNLCKLGVCWVDDLTKMTRLLENLPTLVSLGIKGSLNKTTSLPMEIVYPKSLPNYQNLQSLYLQGKWSTTVTLEASLFPPNLIKLTLIDSQLEQNPMLELGKLQSLKKLCLRYHLMSYTSPIICSYGFPVLQYLEVVGSNIKDLTVAQGVMPKLTYLQLKTPINFKFHLPSELEHVTVKYFSYTLEGKEQICKQFPCASFN